MSTWWELVKKNLSESRTFLIVSALPLFSLAWLFVFLTKAFERDLLSNDFGRDILKRVMENLGVEDMEYSTVAFTMASWTHPIILLIMMLWAISRGSLAVSGELERGTLDLQLTRPISRGAYLSSHIVVAVAGMLLLGVDLLAGYYCGVRANAVPDVPALGILLRPATNYAALGFAIFAVTLAISSISVVRRVPILLVSCYAVANFLLFVIPRQRGMEPWKSLSKYSFFHAFRPGHAVLKGTEYAMDITFLLTVGALACVVAYVGFRWRDLPSNT
jgi:ABC-2 type transport system permease protein